MYIHVYSNAYHHSSDHLSCTRIPPLQHQHHQHHHHLRDFSEFRGKPNCSRIFAQCQWIFPWFSPGFPHFPGDKNQEKKKQGTQGGDLHSEDGCAQGLHQQGGNLEESGDCEWLWMVMSLLIWWFLYITSGIILWTDMNRLLWMVDNGGIMLMNHGDFSIDDCNTTLSLVSIYQLCLIGIYWYIN